MRWSSAQRCRISNQEVDCASLLLVPLAAIVAGFSRGAGGFDDTRSISSASPRRGKGTSRENADVLSHDKGRWTLHLLQRGRAERRADTSAVARASFLISYVVFFLLSALRSLSPCRTRLPGLRTQ